MVQSTDTQQPAGMSEQQFAAILQREAAATPGPWGWRGNTEVRDLRLSALHSGLLTVMDFTRWGMQSARPRFAVDHIMRDGDELVTYEVHRLGWVDRSEPPYRADVDGIDHPDAEFIAAAREDVPALLAEVERLTARLAKLEAAAAAAKDQLSHFILHSEDPGTAALGAQWLLAQATPQVDDPFAEPNRYRDEILREAAKRQREFVLSDDFVCDDWEAALDVVDLIDPDEQPANTEAGAR